MPELSVEQMQNYLLDHLQPETEDEETTALQSILTTSLK